MSLPDARTCTPAQLLCISNDGRSAACLSCVCPACLPNIKKASKEEARRCVPQGQESEFYHAVQLLCACSDPSIGPDEGLLRVSAAAMARLQSREDSGKLNEKPIDALVPALWKYVVAPVGSLADRSTSCSTRRRR